MVRIVMFIPVIVIVTQFTLFKGIQLQLLIDLCSKVSSELKVFHIWIFVDYLCVYVCVLLDFYADAIFVWLLVSPPPCEILDFHTNRRRCKELYIALCDSPQFPAKSHLI